MKIFQIGFNRCGTLTMHGYLRANGVRSVHYDNGKLAQRMFRNLRQGKDILSGYDYDAFFDMEWNGPDEILEGYKLYPQLAARYPDAVFILNTRDREDWIRSRFLHGQGRRPARHKAVLGLSSDEELAERWRREWEAHHSNVVEFFAGKPHRFFVCDIRTDLPDLLDDMLPEYKLDSALYHLQHVRALRNKAQVFSIMHRNHVARLRKVRSFPVALAAAAWGMRFGLRSLRDHLDCRVSRLVNASERATRKLQTASRYFQMMAQGFKGLNGEYVTRQDVDGRMTNTASAGTKR